MRKSNSYSALKIINDWYKKDEATAVAELLASYPFSTEIDAQISAKAAALVNEIREKSDQRTQIEDFMQTYQLNTEEGIALMTLAECLLRIPDKKTADIFIRDKIMSADWADETEQASKMLTNLSSWGLAISNSVLKNEKTTMGRLVGRMGEPIIRQAMVQAMRLMGGHFVTGQTIKEAVSYAKGERKKTQTHTLAYSFDMLGEGARDWHAAKIYLEAYEKAIHHVGKTENNQPSMFKKHGVSVKLSALHPHYDLLKERECIPYLTQTLLNLAVLAKQYGINLTVDAEESRRLDLSLEIFSVVLGRPELKGWDGLGLAIQAYQKRCLPLIDLLADLAQKTGHRIPVRLVKGAYWDAEIKYAQLEGLDDYPVYTRKVSTDVSYLCAAKKMLDYQPVIYPQFATHNAHTLCAIQAMVHEIPEATYEFQRLHGMAEGLYEKFIELHQLKQPLVRVYAPVGAHHDLLPYLVRRLLENGANTSFVHQVHDSKKDIEGLVASPAIKLNNLFSKRHPRVALPNDIYKDRQNAKSIDFYDRSELLPLTEILDSYKSRLWTATSIINGVAQKHRKISKGTKEVYSPADKNHLVGYWVPSTEKQVQKAVDNASKSFALWSIKTMHERASILENIADELEKNRLSFMPLLVFEAGKTVKDALSEIREAIDFCRYYALQAREISAVKTLQGITGEQNKLVLEPRGVFACISPWNFPLAIFIGQISAALVVGNTVVAKSAEQTPLVSGAIVRLMYQAGLPEGVLNLILGDGKIGSVLVKHPDIAGVCFTGSTQTAWTIQESLSGKNKQIRPFIAETGGLNAMIVDSSALPEQVVDDVLASAFYSAGQRCSALRVLYLQEDIAESVLSILKGAMSLLVVGDPALTDTDIGPVIDKGALQGLRRHQNRMHRKYPTWMVPRNKQIEKIGHYIFPSIHEVTSISDIGGEQFGPILHVIRYKVEKIDQVINQINDTKFGLTFGVHSRIDEFIDKVTQSIHAGNVYINRSITGAIVGVQPFGGRGLSGTGPKAGGPNYLQRFMTEKAYSDNVVVRGGDTSLMMLNDLEDL